MRKTLEEVELGRKRQVRQLQKNRFITYARNKQMMEPPLIDKGFF